jgi:hypothetical protein
MTTTKSHPSEDEGADPRAGGAGPGAPGTPAAGGAVDRRGRLDEEVFSYRAGGGDKVLISWHGKQVTILKGKEARRFLDRIAPLSGKDAQLVMAKVTGNFKRGNER